MKFISSLFFALSIMAVAQDFMVQIPGRWVESQFYRHTGSPPFDDEQTARIKVWDSFPNLELSFSWSGGINSRNEAHGEGELIWLKEGDLDIRMSTYHGRMQNGMRDGKGRIHMRSGSTYIGNWSNNLKNGKGIYYYSNGDCYEGSFVNDEWQGEGVYAEANGAVYSGLFERGKRHGSGIIKLPNGTSYESTWVAGVETQESIAKRNAKIAEAPSPHQVVVALDHAYMQKLLSEAETSADHSLLYRSRFLNEAIIIEPNLAWLESWKEKGHLDAAGGIWLNEFSVGPAPLLLTIQNPSKKAITIESARLQVEKSWPELNPILVFYGADADSIHMFPNDDDQDSEEVSLKLPSYMMRFGMTNIGEGKANNCILEYDLKPIGGTTKLTSKQLVKKVGTLDSRVAVDLKPDFAQLGVDLASLQAAVNEGDLSKKSVTDIRNMLGPFARFDNKGKWIESNATLTGTLRYDWTDAEGKLHQESTDVSALVLLDPRNGVEFGAPGPLEGDFHLRLETQGNNYSLPFPFRKRIPAGGSTQFRLRVAAEKNSRHRFTIVINCSDGKQLISPPVSMHYFLPRGYDEFIETQRRPLD